MTRDFQITDELYEKRSGRLLPGLCVPSEPFDVGLSMMCYKKEKEFKTCFGERQDKGRMGKSLY